MGAISMISALLTVGSFIALLVTIPRAIFQFGIETFQMAALNIFLLVWFSFLCKATGKIGGDGVDS